MNSVIDQLNSLIAKTKDYRSLVQSEQWEELQSLTEDRQKQLEIIFSNPIETSIKAVVLSKITEIMELDKQLRNEILLQRRNITAEVIDISSRFKAAQKYQQVNSGS